MSLVSAKTVVENLDPARYDVSLIFIAPDGRWLAADPARLKARVGTEELDLAAGALLAARPTPDLFDAVFPVLHGPLGEDGTMQGLLEVDGVPYVGCGVLASAAGMDKEYTKLAAAAHGLPILPWRRYHHEKDAMKALAELGAPVFVKPARMGSSVGVSKVKTRKELAAAVKNAFRYDDKIVVEKGVVAREIEVAVLGDPWSDKKDGLRASVVGEIAPNAEWYTYESKYLDPDGAKLIIPAPLSKAQTRQVQELALRAFRALDCYGMGRVDFLMDKKTGKIWFNEINTLPGFTSGSMYPLLWRKSGLPTPKLLDELVNLAVTRGRRRAALRSEP